MAGVTVLILALVIVVGGALGSYRGQSAGGDAAARAAVLAGQAAAAAQSGDATSALSLARQALVLDANNAQAKSVVAEVSASGSGASGQGGTSGQGGSSGNGSTSTSSTGQSGSGGTTRTPTSSTASPDTGYAAALADMSTLLPKGLSGYVLDPPVKTKADASRSGSPKRATDVASNILWSVHDVKTVSAAHSFVTKTSSMLYGSDKASVTVHGITAYFGTDGTRFATVVYTRGRYVFEVLVTANAVAPSKLQTLAVTAAGAFTDPPL